MKAVIVCILCCLPWPAALAEPPPPTTAVPAVSVLSYLARKKPRPDSENVILLAKAGKDALGMTEFRLPKAKDEAASIEAASSLALADQLRERIHSLKGKEWNAPAGTEARSYLRGNRIALERLLDTGETRDAWPWFLAQLGEVAEAKKRLLAMYEQRFKEIMASTQLMIPPGGAPLEQEEYLARALEAICEPGEKAGIADKLQKMKVHVSNIPQLRTVG